jgi:hypothetical protein
MRPLSGTGRRSTVSTEDPSAKRGQIPKETTVEFREEERTNKEYLRQQAWSCFQMRAVQRLTTFNFYLVLATAITAGIGVTFQREFRFPELSLILSLLLIAFSFVFLKLEGRNQELIEYAEEALKHFEEMAKADFPDEGGNPHKALLFSYEAQKTEEKEKWAVFPSRYDKPSEFRPTSPPPGKQQWVHFKYKTCLKLAIYLFGLAGVLTLLRNLLCLLPLESAQHLLCS